MSRGQRFLWQGERVTLVQVHPNGTPDHAEPWCQIMRNHGSAGVGFMSIEIRELGAQTD